MTTPPSPSGGFPFIPVDGGSFERNAALLRAEILMLGTLCPPPDPRAFVILSSVGS